METFELKRGVEENRYGFLCLIRIGRSSDDNFGVILSCYPEHGEGWQVQVEYVFECISHAGESTQTTVNHVFPKKTGWGKKKFIDWTELIEKYLKNDKIEVKCHVTIQKVSGPSKKPLTLFDESMKRFSDVVIKVGDQDFYVSKLTLARHSPYFEAMFRGCFEEAKKSEVELKGSDPQDFQDYLELLHVKSSISDSNVEKLLEFSEMYDTPLVIEKCNEYLMTANCKLSRRDKIRLASRFNLDILVDHCVSECETFEDLREMLPDDITDFDPNIVKSVLGNIFDRMLI